MSELCQLNGDIGRQNGCSKKNRNQLIHRLMVLPTTAMRKFCLTPSRSANSLHRLKEPKARPLVRFIVISECA
jgi:hypothetical protein